MVVLRDYFAAWSSFDTEHTKTLIDRLAWSGIVYTSPLDSPTDKKEMATSLLWGHFGGLFYVEAIPGEEASLCVVTKTGETHRTPLVDKYRDQVQHAKKLLLGVHVLVHVLHKISAFPYIRQELTETYQGPLSWVLLQQSKPPATRPCFACRFRIDYKVPTIFGYPGDLYTEPDCRIWVRVHCASNRVTGLGIVFGKIGDTRSLDVRYIVCREGVVAKSGGTQPWSIRSYLYSGGHTLEYELVPVFRQEGGVLVLCFQNDNPDGSRLDIELGTANVDDSNGIDYKRSSTDVPGRSLSMFGAIETTTHGSFVIKTQHNGVLSL